MNSDYKVGDLIYDANIYDGMNTSMDDLQFYKRWLPKNKDALAASRPLKMRFVNFKILSPF